MGGSSNSIISAVVDPVGTLINITPAKRALEGKPIVGSTITDPTGAKAAAKEAAKEGDRQAARQQAAEDELKKKEKEAQAAEAAAVTRAQSRALSRVRERSAGLGSRSTILTSPLGLITSPTGQQKTLLGA